MEQTVLPFSQVIEQQRRKWMPFKRALRKQDQEAFEQLFVCKAPGAGQSVFPAVWIAGGGDAGSAPGASAAD